MNIRSYSLATHEARHDKMAVSGKFLAKEGKRIMTTVEKQILDKFKSLIGARVKLHKMILFGSRARGDANRYSDMDVIVILERKPSDRIRDYISDCAWEAGFDHGIVVVPVVFSKKECERGPERYSLLVQAAKSEGVAL